MMVIRGKTTHFIVSYDDTLSNGIPLADAVLSSCEYSLATLSYLFGGIMPAADSFPFQINLVPGLGGAGHPGCLSTIITCNIYSGSSVQGIPALVTAEIAEVFMATQAQGVNCGYSNGEALSRVLATVVYPNSKRGFSTGNEWLNSSRPDWVDNTEETDQDMISIGCGSLFLNYLAHQLWIPWKDIIAAGAPTLEQTAANLSVTNVWDSFSKLINTFFPVGTTANLMDDDPFPLLIVPYEVFKVNNLLIEDGLCIDGKKNCQIENGITGGGYYAKAGDFIALNCNANKLTKLIIEQGTATSEKKTLTVGETWDVGGGWILTANSIDAKANPRQVWLTLSKDGIKKDDKVVAQGMVYTYIEKSIAGESDVPMFVTYVDSIFAGAISDLVQLKYTWVISP